jgi:hypothetical protein
MAEKTTTTTFNINIPSTSLNVGEKLIFKFQMEGNSTGSFTASLGTGTLKVSSLAASLGYASTPYSYFSSASIATGSNSSEIIFSPGVSGFHGGDYLFVPNPLSGSISTLYDEYGDVDYNFVINPFDIILIYLSDNTFVEARVLNVYSQTGLLHVGLDIELSATLKSELANQTYTRFLVLSRRQDETNVILSFTKRDGKTSYGFLIPENISPAVLANIDTITKEVKQKLLNDQPAIDNINGGSF